MTILHDALSYQVLVGVLTATAAGFGLWSYRLKENAEPPYRLAGEGISISIDLRTEMRAAADRAYASRGARGTQWIANLLVIATVPIGFASLYTTGRVNIAALAALVPIASAVIIGLHTLRTIRIARACDRFDSEYVGSGRHKYESFEVAWATFERVHPRDARIGRRHILAERVAGAARHDRAMADYTASIERLLSQDATSSRTSVEWP
jgi:hypothetical protein